MTIGETQNQRASRGRCVLTHNVRRRIRFYKSSGTIGKKRSREPRKIARGPHREKEGANAPTTPAERRINLRLFFPRLVHPRGSHASPCPAGWRPVQNNTIADVTRRGFPACRFNGLGALEEPAYVRGSTVRLGDCCDCWRGRECLLGETEVVGSWWIRKII